MQEKGASHDFESFFEHLSLIVFSLPVVGGIALADDIDEPLRPCLTCAEAHRQQDEVNQIMRECKFSSETEFRIRSCTRIVLMPAAAAGWGSSGVVGAIDEAFVYRGDAYMEEKDYAHAISDYTSAIANESDEMQAETYGPVREEFEFLSRAYFGRGVAYWWRKDTDHAIADFNKVLKLTPTGNLATEATSNIQKLQQVASAASEDGQGFGRIAGRWSNDATSESISIDRDPIGGWRFHQSDIGDGHISLTNRYGANIYVSGRQGLSCYYEVTITDGEKRMKLVAP